MTTVLPTVDKRELSTIVAALMLLQEQMQGLPEDVAEMLSQHGRPLKEAEIDRLAARLQRALRSERPNPPTVLALGSPRSP